MSRLVQPSRTVTIEHRAIDRSGRARMVPETATVGGDNYLDRIAKYIPTEIMAGYMSLDRLVVPSTSATAATRSADAAAGAATMAASPTGAEILSNNLPLIVFFFALIVTPFYIMQIARRSQPGTPWITHAVLATIAFLIWAYAMAGSVFVSSQLYSPQVAGVLLVAFSIVSGFFAPAPVREDQ